MTEPASSTSPSAATEQRSAVLMGATSYLVLLLAGVALFWRHF